MPPAAAEGGDPVGRPHRHAGDAGTRHATGPCATGQSCSLALPVACAAPRLPVSTSDATRPRTARLLDKGLLLRLRGKTGWREVEIGRGSADTACPVVAVATWIRFAKLAQASSFAASPESAKTLDRTASVTGAIARLVKSAALAAGLHGGLSERERAAKFSGHSLRAALGSSAEVDERHVQKQLGHASAEMTRKYQRRRDRFRINLTEASGL